MKLGPVTKPDKRHKTTSKKIDHDVMSTNCDIIVIFPIYDQIKSQTSRASPPPQKTQPSKG